MSKQRPAMRTRKSNQTLALLVVCGMATGLVGCKEKSSTASAFDKTKTSAQDAGSAIKDATQKTGVAVKDAAQETGKVVENAAEKTWEGIKKGAAGVTHVATNVAGEVRAGAVKVGEKVKDATN